MFDERAFLEKRERKAERRKAQGKEPPFVPFPPPVRAKVGEKGQPRADRRAHAFRRPTADSPRRMNASAQLRPRFLGAASSGVTRIFPCPSPASSSQAGH